MRNLYARFVLWLIRPALELREPQVTVTNNFVSLSTTRRALEQQAAAAMARELSRRRA